MNHNAHSQKLWIINKATRDIFQVLKAAGKKSMFSVFDNGNLNGQQVASG
jgi:hypothetical protein